MDTSSQGPDETRPPEDGATGDTGGERSSGPQSPAAEAQTAADGTRRRLTRSRSDRLIGGVCGGLGRHLAIDPVIVRIVAVAFALVGGAGVLLYLAALLLMPADPQVMPADPQAVPPPGAPAGPGVGADTRAESPGDGGAGDRGRTLGIVAIALVLLVSWPLLLGGGLLLAGLLVPLAMVALVGLAVWWLTSGASPGGEPGEVVKHALLGIATLIGCFAIFVTGGFAAAAGGGVLAGPS